MQLIARFSDPTAAAHGSAPDRRGSPQRTPGAAAERVRTKRAVCNCFVIGQRSSVATAGETETAAIAAAAVLMYECAQKFFFVRVRLCAVWSFHNDAQNGARKRNHIINANYVVRSMCVCVFMYYMRNICEHMLHTQRILVSKTV